MHAGHPPTSGSESRRVPQPGFAVRTSIPEGPCALLFRADAQHPNITRYIHRGFYWNCADCFRSVVRAWRQREEHSQPQALRCGDSCWRNRTPCRAGRPTSTDSGLCMHASTAANGGAPGLAPSPPHFAAGVFTPSASCDFWSTRSPHSALCTFPPGNCRLLQPPLNRLQRPIHSLRLGVPIHNAAPCLGLPQLLLRCRARTSPHVRRRSRMSAPSALQYQPRAVVSTQYRAHPPVAAPAAAAATPVATLPSRHHGSMQRGSVPTSSRRPLRARAHSQHTAAAACRRVDVAPMAAIGRQRGQQAPTQEIHQAAVEVRRQVGGARPATAADDVASR